jgi:hypothetical protein
LESDNITYVGACSLRVNRLTDAGNPRAELPDADEAARADVEKPQLPPAGLGLLWPQRRG